MQYETTTNPDLAMQWQRLTADEQAHSLIANRADDAKLRADATAKRDDLTKQREQLEADIADAARIITVERIHPKTWGRLVAEHPVRPGDPYDQRLGFNTDTFDEPLMAAAITTVTDGNLQPVDWAWRDLANSMTPGQYEQILSDMIRLHMERDAVPFSLADYRSRQPSAPSSK